MLVYFLYFSNALVFSGVSVPSDESAVQEERSFGFLFFNGSTEVANSMGSRKLCSLSANSFCGKFHCKKFQNESTV